MTKRLLAGMNQKQVRRLEGRIKAFLEEVLPPDALAAVVLHDHHKVRGCFHNVVPDHAVCNLLREALEIGRLNTVENN